MRIDEIEPRACHEPEQLNERTFTRKKVVRKGKVIKKKVCGPGFRLVGGRRCIRQKPAERRKRRIGARIGNRKGKAARMRTRTRSLRVRRRRRL
jgi:hypothetical protein